MSRSRTALLVACGVVAGALIVPPGIAAAKSAVQEVLITNTTNQPVPVTGAIGVTNTAANPVPVSGTVAVNGTVAVADAREPFEIRVNVSLPSGEFSSSGSFVVPEGKRLVVEFASAQVSVPDGQKPFLSANANTGALGFAFPLEDQGVGTGNRFFASAGPILDFAPAGFYTIGFNRQQPAGGPVPGSGSGFVYLSGYMLPA